MYMYKTNILHSHTVHIYGCIDYIVEHSWYFDVTFMVLNIIIVIHAHIIFLMNLHNINIVSI